MTSFDERCKPIEEVRIEIPTKRYYSRRRAGVLKRNVILVVLILQGFSIAGLLISVTTLYQREAKQGVQKALETSEHGENVLNFGDGTQGRKELTKDVLVKNGLAEMVNAINDKSARMYENDEDDGDGELDAEIESEDAEHTLVRNKRRAKRKGPRGRGRKPKGRKRKKQRCHTNTQPPLKIITKRETVEENPLIENLETNTQPNVTANQSENNTIEELQEKINALIAKIDTMNSIVNGRIDIIRRTIINGEKNAHTYCHLKTYCKKPPLPEIMQPGKYFRWNKACSECEMEVKETPGTFVTVSEDGIYFVYSQTAAYGNSENSGTEHGIGHDTVRIANGLDPDDNATTLMSSVSTQVHGGRKFGGKYPQDTNYQGGVFELAHGDQIGVRPFSTYRRYKLNGDKTYFGLILLRPLKTNLPPDIGFHRDDNSTQIQDRHRHHRKADRRTPRN
ncbi:unnamed protein product [Owenia fusiformis]|uniref:THD domain-containing protein n=1 Tax=Owenia fusiformis TaxID=6347 RepID=A0A8J1UBB2_OWEFU|nr:unnamed protein product [Owenia fusiformis]